MGELTAPREQTTFCEDGALSPSPLSSAVVKALMDTSEGKDARQNAEEQGQVLDPFKLFNGSRIHLSDSRDTFFLVTGQYPTSGADNTWFWVVRLSGEKAVVLLHTGANCLALGRGRTFGYRDIVAAWSSASQTLREVFKYDARVYKSRRKAWHTVS
jgi:hypothetical protein